ncbi:MAG: hypothetical protein RR440_00435 [Erysipelotrichaceae bacterium]
MTNLQLAVEKVSSLSVTLQVTGVPATEQPLACAEMEGNAIDLYNFSTRFMREDNECELINIDEAEFMEMNATSLSIVKQFEEVSVEEVKAFMGNLSTILLMDNITGKVITANVTGIESYDYN